MAMMRARVQTRGVAAGTGPEAGVEELGNGQPGPGSCPLRAEAGTVRNAVVTQAAAVAAGAVTADYPSETSVCVGGAATKHDVDAAKIGYWW
jgi:hypothetical protein